MFRFDFDSKYNYFVYILMYMINIVFFFYLWPHSLFYSFKKELFIHLFDDTGILILNITIIIKILQLMSFSI